MTFYESKYSLNKQST